MKQFDYGWEYKKLTKFSFEDDCNKLKIEITINTAENVAAVEYLSNMEVSRILLTTTIAV